MVDKVIKALLLFSPISYIRGVNLEKFDIVFFQFGCIAVFIASVFDNNRKELNKSFLYLVYLLILAGINLLFHTFNLLVLTNYINLFLAVMVVLAVINNVKDIESLYKYSLIAVSINILFYFFQLAGWNPIISGEFTGKQGGLMGNAPRLVDFLSIMIPFMPWCLIYVSGIVALTTKELTFFIILAVIMAMRHGIIAKLIISALLVGCCVFFWDKISFSLYHRWIVWRPTVEVLLQQPIKGYGLGMFPFVSDQIFHFTVKDIHGHDHINHVEYIYNSYLNVIFGLGVLALIPIGLFIKRFFENFKYSKIHYSILAVILLSLIEYPFEIPRLWLTLCVLIAIYLKQTEVIE